MKIGKTLINMLKKMNFGIYHQKIIHLGDLLTPVDGKVTGTQYIIASRIADIQNYRNGKPFYWDMYLSECVHGYKYSLDVTKKFHFLFENLIKSMDKNGFYDLNSLGFLFSKKPLMIMQGTHRLACLCESATNTYVHCEADKEICYGGIEGYNYWLSKGISSKNLKFLEKIYYDAISKIRTELTGYVEENEFANVEECIKEYGSIKNTERILIDSKQYIVFNFILNKQYLYFEKGVLYSKYCKEIEEKLNMRINSNKYKIAHSVTESTLLECKIFEQYQNKLKKLIKNAK